MNARTYAQILGALASGEALTYGGISRPERMHVQSMRRDGLAYVRDANGALLESLDGDPRVKTGWGIGITDRGRECARALAPFATGAPVTGKPSSDPAPARSSSPARSSDPGSICGHVTRKGTPCQARVNPKTGACSLVPSHGGPVTVRQGEPVALEARPSSGTTVADALDPDTLAAIRTLVASGLLG